ncbi:MAG TPA: hypothetical protein PLN52_22675 [Opitutaceae bacterium]|nr:hypothetical protein [Opitutaceae bacterium]
MSEPPEYEKAPGDDSRGAFQNRKPYDRPKFDREESRRQLDSAKERIGISDLWRHYGFPGEPRGLCASPFRPDRKPSFSIINDRGYRDHATGETGDQVTFIEQASGCTTAEAITKLIEIAGGNLVASSPVVSRVAKAPTSRKPLKLPDFEAPSVAALTRIQQVRGWPTFAGLELARIRRNLFLCIAVDDREPRTAWALTDDAHKSVQVRPLDGSVWNWSKAKAWTLGGSVAGWPIGTANIGDRPIVAFCEGGPDFLAALTLAFLHGIHERVACVFMPGATASIVPEALGHFAGKRVRIFEHADKAGAAAGPRWAEQLTDGGATVDGFILEAPHKDLADLLASVDAESLEPAVNIFAGLTEDSKCR